MTLTIQGKPSWVNRLDYEAKQRDDTRAVGIVNQMTIGSVPAPTYRTLSPRQTSAAWPMPQVPVGTFSDSSFSGYFSTS